MSQNHTFVTEESYEKNLKNQVSMTPGTLKQLAGHGVTPDRCLRLEYFFYTNELNKGRALSEELLGKRYSSEVRASASDHDIFVITGWTTPITMQTDGVIEWTEGMCHLGYRHDCEFDGWGTHPNQPTA